MATKTDVEVAEIIEIPEPEFEEEWIKVKDLNIDRAVQRGFLDVRKVERIVNNFNSNALGVISVSRRARMVNIVLDGQHRVEAVRRLTGGDGEMLCQVFKGLSREREAGMFLDLNDGNKPSLIDRFKVRIVRGDEVAIAMNEILEGYSWKVGAGTAAGTFQCVGQAEKIYRQGVTGDAEGNMRYPTLFQETMMIISRSWKNDTAGVMAPILEAISRILLEYGDTINVDHLIRTLASYSGGPHGLLEDGRALARSLRGRPAMGVASRLVDEYNIGMKTRKLYAWRHRR